MENEAYITHRTPERLRIRIPSRKGNGPYFETLRAECLAIPGVKHAEANPVTGSILLHLRSEITIQEVSAFLKLRLGTPQRMHFDQRLVQEVGSIDDKVQEFTGGELGLRSIAFFGLLATGLYQMSIGNLVAPAWYVAFWYALSLAPRGQKS
ncbi:MAG: HMA2 domain-containing protein [Syntrophobacter sp.]